MACNCKVGQQIDFLHKKYGDNLPKNKKTNIRGSALAILENTLLYIAIIPLTPLMLIYLIINSISGKKIHIDKLVKLA